MERFDVPVGLGAAGADARVADLELRLALLDIVVLVVREILKLPGKRVEEYLVSAAIEATKLL